jgi:hypothetical protein
MYSRILDRTFGERGSKIGKIIMKLTTFWGGNELIVCRVYSIFNECDIKLPETGFLAEEFLNCTSETMKARQFGLEFTDKTQKVSITRF